MAACYNHSDVSALLLKAGAIVDAPRSDGATPLHIAARKGNADVAAVLLRAGASVDAMTTRGHTPLVAAVQFGHTDVVALLRNPPRAVGALPRDPASSGGGAVAAAGGAATAPAKAGAAPSASGSPGSTAASMPAGSAAASRAAAPPASGGGGGGARPRGDTEASLAEDPSAPRLVRAATEDGASAAADINDPAGVAAMGPEEVAEALTAFVCRGLPGPTKLAYRAAVRAATAEHDVTGSAIVYESAPEDLARTLLEGYKKGTLPRGSLNLTVRFIKEAQQAAEAAPVVAGGGRGGRSAARAGRNA